MENKPKIYNEKNIPMRFLLFTDREQEHLEKYNEIEKKNSKKTAFQPYNTAIRLKMLSAIDEIEWALDKFPREQLQQVFTDQTIDKLSRIIEEAKNINSSQKIGGE